MQLSVQLYVSSFGNEANREYVRSKRIQNLFLAHAPLLDEIIVADLNQEIIQARNSLMGVLADQSVLCMDRLDLAHRLGLVKSGQAVDPSGVDLPQAFLVVTKDGKTLDRNFLGHYQTVQYLEDCGILAKVLSGDLCPHYRQYSGRIFYSWCRPLEQLDSNVEICATCHFQEHS